MTAADAAEREQARRTEYVCETRTALQNGERYDERAGKREAKADEWAAWLHRKMDETGCATPTELLPDALARLEQMSEDHAAAAVRELRAILRKALGP
jgi:hypothetical protein